MLDRRLGYIFYIALIAITLYVVVFVKLLFCLIFNLQNFGIKKKYLVSNFKQGIVNLRSLGQAHSVYNNKLYIWDSSNLLFSETEDHSVILEECLQSI